MTFTSLQARAHATRGAAVTAHEIDLLVELIETGHRGYAGVLHAAFAWTPAELAAITGMSFGRCGDGQA